jgi:hypothetical protein
MPGLVATEWLAVLFGVALCVAPWVLSYTPNPSSSSAKLTAWPVSQWIRQISQSTGMPELRQPPIPTVAGNTTPSGPPTILKYRYSASGPVSYAHSRSS